MCRFGTNTFTTGSLFDLRFTQAGSKNDATSAYETRSIDDAPSFNRAPRAGHSATGLGLRSAALLAYLACRKSMRTVESGKYPGQRGLPRLLLTDYP